MLRGAIVVGLASGRRGGSRVGIWVVEEGVGVGEGGTAGSAAGVTNVAADGAAFWRVGGKIGALALAACPDVGHGEVVDESTKGGWASEVMGVRTPARTSITGLSSCVGSSKVEIRNERRMLLRWGRKRRALYTRETRCCFGGKMDLKMIRVSN